MGRPCSATPPCRASPPPSIALCAPPHKRRAPGATPYSPPAPSPSTGGGSALSNSSARRRSPRARGACRRRAAAVWARGGLGACGAALSGRAPRQHLRPTMRRVRSLSLPRRLRALGSPQPRCPPRAVASMPDNDPFSPAPAPSSPRIGLVRSSPMGDTVAWALPSPLAPGKGRCSSIGIRNAAGKRRGRRRPAREHLGAGSRARGGRAIAPRSYAQNSHTTGTAARESAPTKLRSLPTAPLPSRSPPRCGPPGARVVRRGRETPTRRPARAAAARSRAAGASVPGALCAPPRRAASAALPPRRAPRSPQDGQASVLRRGGGQGRREWQGRGPTRASPAASCRAPPGRDPCPSPPVRQARRPQLPAAGPPAQ
jgi:hypothetical protein